MKLTEDEIIGKAAEAAIITTRNGFRSPLALKNALDEAKFVTNIRNQKLILSEDIIKITSKAAILKINEGASKAEAREAALDTYILYQAEQNRKDDYEIDILQNALAAADSIINTSAKMIPPTNETASTEKLTEKETLTDTARPKDRASKFRDFLKERAKTKVIINK